MLIGDNRQQDIIEGLAEGAGYYPTRSSTAELLERVKKMPSMRGIKKHELIALRERCGGCLVVSVDRFSRSESQYLAASPCSGAACIRESLL